VLHDVLGRLWVAHVWECDLLAEQRLTHRTTVGNRRGQKGDKGSGPWLISRAMWLLAPRFTDPALVGLTNPGGLDRWGYVLNGRPTRHATAAAAVFGPLGAEVDGRWAERFGADVVGRARTALTELTAELGDPLWALPVVPYQTGLRTDADAVAAAPALVARAERDLSELMAGPLLRLTLGYEERSRLGLPLVADLLRVLDEPRRVRDLPVVTGASVEAVSSMLGFAERRELVVVEDRVARATDKGHRVRGRHDGWLAKATAGWAGSAAAEEALAPILSSERLAEGLAAPESSWRRVAPYRARSEAVLADPRVHLPRHPLVLHRGGYPDGS
jgi:hypothetical protein